MKAYTNFRPENIEPMLNLPVSVGFHFQTIVVTFHPIPFLIIAIIAGGERSEEKDNEQSAKGRLRTDNRVLALAATKVTAAANAVKWRNPELTHIGDPRDLNNYLPDSGATQHMTPHLADLHDTVRSKT